MMNICVTVNSKYQKYLYIMLKSLYENNKKGSISLYVIQRDFTEDDKKIITEITSEYGNTVDFIWIDEHIFDDMPIYRIGRTNLSLEIYFRLLIPEYLPQDIDRALMLDVDIVVNKSIEDLYNIDFENHYMAAAPNMCHNCIVNKGWREWYGADRNNWTHYNTGILMWNLKKIREDLPKEYIFKAAWKHKIKTSTFEEELFNVEFGESGIKEIESEKWNYISTHQDWHKNPNYKKYNNLEEIRKECHIIHYAAMNPWQAGPKNDSFILWWDWAKKTPYYLEILESCYQNSENYIANIHHRMDIENNKLQYIDKVLDLENQKMFVDKLNEQNVKNIVIYGASRIARCMENVLRNTNISILCFVDKNTRGEFCGAKVVDFEGLKQYEGKADMIVVSTPYYYDEILSEVSEYTNLPIVNIDNII